VRGLLIFAGSFLAGYLVNSIFCRGLLRLALRTQTNVDDVAVKILRLPVYLTVLLIGLNWSLRVVGITDTPLALAVAATKTVLVIVWAIGISRIVRLVLRGIGADHPTSGLIQARTLPLFENIAYILVLGGAVYLILLQWQVNVTAWVASAGVAGIAVGFAAKDTLANLFAGIFIIADAPYQIGDFIVLDSGERGKVTDIGLRSTRILTRDDIEIIVPNAVIANAKIVNESAGPHPKERLRIAVSVAYGTDMDRVREILLGIATSEKGICSHPEPRVRFRAFGDSGLLIELMVWIEEPVLRGRVLDDMNDRVYKAFGSEGIEIPYPKRDVYVRTVPAEGGGITGETPKAD